MPLITKKTDSSHRIAHIAVKQEGLVRVQKIENFKDAGLHPAMLRNVELCGYKTPTPIQAYCLPAIKMGHDLLAIAQTGECKTLPYRFFGEIAVLT